MILISHPINAKNIDLRSHQVNLAQLLLKQGYKKIPLQLASKQNTLLVPLSLDHNSPGSFILDTGSAHSEIDPKLANKLHLKPDANSSIVVGGVDKLRHRVFKTKAPFIYLSDLRFSNEPFYIADQSPKKVDKKPILGILGIAFLEKHQAVIDVYHKQLYLKLNPSNPYININKPQEFLENVLTKYGYCKLTLKKTPTNHRTLSASVNQSVTKPLLFDSGMPYSMLSLSFAKRLNLKLQKIMTIGGSSGGKIPIYQTRIKKFSIGKLTSHFQDIKVMDFTHVKVGTPIYGVIGLDWMRRHQVIIDLKNSQIFAFRYGN